ncbi:MAG: 1-acyl-sn-glycerol-3-phosphate acyltransferase [Candidatus Rokuibacteriota bacterium]|nr:MAG: 1-acyl-sn-glycerol-3-phosphate acyltransferase [Candidatus Rokubacteria bacterium]
MRLYSVVDALLRPLLMRIYRVEVRGSTRVPASGAAILAANHESVLDGFFLALATRRPLRFMAKVELYRHPFVGQLLDALGAFPVDRRRDEGRSIARGVELLERGEAIGIFPQGTCIPYRHRPFRLGAARLARATGAPLVPVALINSEKALRPGRPRLGLPRVAVLVGEPIQVERAQPDPSREAELTARLERAVERLREPFGAPAHVWID